MVSAVNMAKKSAALFTSGEGVTSASYYPTHDTAEESAIAYPTVRLQRPTSANNHDATGHTEASAATLSLPLIADEETPIDVRRGQFVVDGLRYQIKGIAQDSPLCRKFRVTHVDAAFQVTLKDKAVSMAAGGS